MTKTELIGAIAEELNFSKPQAKSVLNTILETMTDTLAQGDSIELRGFGSFVVRQYGSYEGRNPNTGEKVQVKAKKRAHFRVGKNFRVKLNKE